MLNELYSLSATLESKNITVEEWYDDYDELPLVTSKAPCIRIWLANDGSVCGIESISAEHAQSLRKFGKNQGSFPAFNIVPLYRITDKQQISELELIEKENTKLDLDIIGTWCVIDNWKKSVVEKINRSLHDFPKSMLRLIGNQTETEYLLISELARLAADFSNEPDNNFRVALEKCVFSKLQNQEDINLALAMLFYKGNSEKAPKDDVGSLSVILDLFDWEQYNYPVASEHTTKWINTILINSDQANIHCQSMGREKDAFNAPFVAITRPMPSVKLSGFEVTLRSMFNGQPSQSRYKQINDGSYPITLKNRSLAKKSLIWLAKREHEGVTWRKVDKNEIVFVYPSKLPEVPPKFASIFGSSQAENPMQTEARFEIIAKEFIKTLMGIPTHEKPDSIQIFAIRKIDKARSKVIFSRNCSPEQLINAAENWEIGCSNIPEIDLGERIIPFPLQVARIVNNVWKQNGDLAQGQAAVERMKYYQGMELMLDIMQDSMICNYLHILLTNSSGLVKYLGNLAHGESKNKDKTEGKNFEKQKRETVLLLSVLGLLLDKNDDRKEKYMENMAYLVGQLLKISDELHTLYCKVVRGGDVPPQLAGSALFVTAGEIPHQAITQLSIRMNPYITWAKQYRFKNIKDEGKESWKAAWYLKLYEDAANKLRLALSDSLRFSDFEKAQLFIGYLASFPKSEPAAITTDNNNNEII